MNIFILGAGQVGSSIATFLDPDPTINVTVIDNDARSIDLLNGRNLDLKTVLGNASHPSVLQDAGVEDAEIVLAVTGSDEANIVACQICYEVFSTPMRIARIRSDQYQRYDLFSKDNPAFAIDEVINPEGAVTQQFYQLIKNQGASEILQFCEGVVEVVTFRTTPESILFGKTIGWLKNRIEMLYANIVGVRKSNDRYPSFYSDLSQDTTLQVDDEIYVVCDTRVARSMFLALNYQLNATSKVVIAGGGHIGEGLAIKLRDESTFNQITVIERDPARCQYLEKSLSNCVVIQGDATDKNLLESNYVDKANIYCAITDDDEVNIMSSLLAKQIGVSHVLSLIKKQDYLDIVANTAIDVPISPQQSTASAIFRHVREVSPDVIQGINDNLSQVMEITVKAGQREDIIGGNLYAIPLPVTVQLIAIRKGQEIILGDALANVIFEEWDRLLFFISNVNDVAKVESLFRLNPVV